MINRWLLAVGGVITRVTLSQPLRRFAVSRFLYAAAYLTGKRISDRREIRFLRPCVRPGMTILDIGANAGAFTAQFARWIGPAGQVWAFEPDPLTFAILQKRSRRFSNVTPVPVALGAFEGTVPLYCGRSNRADNRLGSHDGDAEVVQVTMTRGDQFFEGADLRVLHGIKIDVQGAELDVLAGLRTTILRLRPSWLFVEFSPALLRANGRDPAEFFQLLSELRYVAFRVDTGEPVLIEDVLRFTTEVGSGYTDVWARPA